MGIVALAVVWWSAPTAEAGLREALADADGHSRRGIWRLRVWWNRRHYRASIRHQRERHCRQSGIGGTGEEHSGGVISRAAS
jgi:hypothetical protein